MREVMAQRFRNERLFWHEEGAQTTASVHLQPFGRRVMYVNGLHQANDSPEMVGIHRQMGYLPLALHPDPRRALVIGLGGGATAGAVSQYPGLEIDVVELSGTVVRAAEHFAHINFDILKNSRVNVLVDDGRSHLLLSGQRYDVITADIIQPKHAGAGNVYSAEYFTLARSALAENGLMLQWIGQRETTQYKLIARTFLRVFPHTTVWAGGTLMIGSRDPLRLDPGALERRIHDPATADIFTALGVRAAADLAGLYSAGPEEFRRFVGDGPMLRDDRPSVEYFLSLPDDPLIDLATLHSDSSDVFLTPEF
jgi:spermidine synthase